MYSFFLSLYHCMHERLYRNSKKHSHANVSAHWMCVRMLCGCYPIGRMQKSTQKWSAHHEWIDKVSHYFILLFVHTDPMLYTVQRGLYTVNEMNTDSNGMLNMFVSILICFFVCIYVPMSLSDIIYRSLKQSLTNCFHFARNWICFDAHSSFTPFSWNLDSANSNDIGSLQIHSYSNPCVFSWITFISFIKRQQEQWRWWKQKRLHR